MNASESTGRNSGSTPHAAAKKLGKDGAVGLGLLGVAFVIAVGISWYSANTLAERDRDSGAENAE
jgi:hypothetical protein